ncbi:hypothetical protein ACFYO5_13440 [Streptomyces sp. NPDC006259]|uniref:hypothetical protein n=1 Tax=Streptomyces sp. NPDC006259 TaxID=3364740 RepID=UPI0036C48DA8
MWIRDRLYGLFRDEAFTARYPRDGRLGLSPAQPATLCVLPYALNVPDRQAAEAVRCRTDFTYASAWNPKTPAPTTACCPTSPTGSPGATAPTGCRAWHRPRIRRAGRSRAEPPAPVGHLHRE